MLGEEDVWALLMDESQLSSNKETFFTQEKPDPLIQAKEFVYRLNVERKTTIFPDSFETFEYQCWVRERKGTKKHLVTNFIHKFILNHIDEIILMEFYEWLDWIG